MTALDTRPRLAICQLHRTQWYVWDDTIMAFRCPTPGCTAYFTVNPFTGR